MASVAQYQIGRFPNLGNPASWINATNSTKTAIYRSGFTNRQANGYYQYGGNGTLSHLMGSHNLKVGGDYRNIGATSLNYGASTGTFSFTGGFSGNSLANTVCMGPVSSRRSLASQARCGLVQKFFVSVKR